MRSQPIRNLPPRVLLSGGEDEAGGAGVAGVGLLVKKLAGRVANEVDWHRPRGRAVRALLWLLVPLAVMSLLAGVLVVRVGLGRTAQRPHPTGTMTSAANAARVTAPAGTLAYISAGQVMLVRPGADPRPLTHFAQPDVDPTHWGPIVWAPGGAALAVAVGNPVVDANQVAGAQGALYVVTLRDGTARLVTTKASAEQGVAIGVASYAWEDASQLLYAESGTVFSYQVATGMSAPLAGLARTTVLDLAVRGHALYYTSYASPEGPLTALSVALRRFDLQTHSDSQVADLGTVVMQVTGCDVTGCMAAPGVAATLPAWDVSPDERALAFERLTSLSADRTVASVTFYFATAVAKVSGGAQSALAAPGFGTPRVIFTGVSSRISAGMPNACCYLRFSPDGRALALTSGYAMPQPFGPYLLYPGQASATYQTGFPWAFGPASWSPDSRTFCLTTHRGSAPVTTLLAYGNETTDVLAEDGSDGAYAPAGG